MLTKEPLLYETALIKASLCIVWQTIPFNGCYFEKSKTKLDGAPKRELPFDELTVLLQPGVYHHMI
jgi:hypothetical protein